MAETMLSPSPQRTARIINQTMPAMLNATPTPWVALFKTSSTMEYSLCFTELLMAISSLPLGLLWIPIQKRVLGSASSELLLIVTQAILLRQ